MFKFHFFSLFGELLTARYRSLEFRAKVLSAMLCAKMVLDDGDYSVITQIASSIYGNDEKRSNLLLHTIKDYVKQIKVYRTKTLDSLLIDIDNELKSVPRYAKKIDFAHLRQMMCESEDDDITTQQQVYEYMLNEVQRYTKQA